MISLLIIRVNSFIGCKFRHFSAITQEKATFFRNFSTIDCLYQFFFVPLHPLFSCDGELSQTILCINNLI